MFILGIVQKNYRMNGLNIEKQKSKDIHFDLTKIIKYSYNVDFYELIKFEIKERN